MSEAYIPPSAGAVALGFATPAATVVDVADQLLATGTAEHAYVGIQPATLTPQIAPTGTPPGWGRAEVPSGLGDGQTEEDADDEARSASAHCRPGTRMGGGGGRRLACLGGLGAGLGSDLDCLGRFQRMHTLGEVLIIFWHGHVPLSLQS